MYVTHMISQYKHNIPTFSGNSNQIDNKSHYLKIPHIDNTCTLSAYTKYLYEL
jgi:hypothetical protein